MMLNKYVVAKAQLESLQQDPTMNLMTRKSTTITNMIPSASTG